MKILFIGNTRLGDAILSTCILNYYVDKSINITVVCSPLSENIYKNFPSVINIIAVDKKKRGKHWLEVYFALDRIYWDLVIDLRNSIVSRLVRKKKILRIGKINPNQHRVESLCKLIKVKNIIAPSIPVSSTLMNKALKIISDHKIALPILAIAPVTNWQRKNWPIENFALLINKLMKQSSVKKKFKCIVIIGSKNEKVQCNYLVKKIKNISVINLCGSYDISVFYALLKYCKLFIGNDSGLMHLSAAAKINTLGLFGPSKDINYRPWGKKSFFLRTDIDYDNLVNIKGYSRHDSSSLMSSLTVEKVFQKCLDIIN
tara:strand:- start:11098 stop:12045 length:948 start_codon:yes stop_codon:yes gene_type:complete